VLLLDISTLYSAYVDFGRAVITLLPVIASVLATASSVPQLVLLLRARSATGVSIAGWATNASASAVWIVVSLLNGSTATALALLAPAALTLTVFILSFVWGGNRRGLATPFIFLGVVTIVAATGNPQLLTALLATTVFWAFGPSIYAMWTADDLSGNSVATWAMAGVYGIVWGGHGLIQGDAAVTFNGAVNLLLGSAVLIGLVLAKRGIRDEVIATVTGQFTAITTATAQFAIIRPATAALAIIRPATASIPLMADAAVPPTTLPTPTTIPVTAPTA
jgi:uncharacterized protein with PQ loop repeat